jgi:hypothetical protein
VEVAVMAKRAPRKRPGSAHFPDLPITPDRFESHLDELLEIAGVENSVEARSYLVIALQVAQANYGLQLKTYPDSRDVAFVLYPVGGGVVDVATAQEMIRRPLELPRHPLISDEELRWPPRVARDGMIAGINIELLLRLIMIREVRRRARGLGQPTKQDKYAIVSQAVQFFCLRSSKKPTTDPNNAFVKFAQQFYRIVTGDDVEVGGLDWQIRKVLKDRRSAGD